MVVVAVGAGLLNGQPAASPIPAVAQATPMAGAAKFRVLGQDEEGRLEIRTQSVREVCPIGAQVCSAAPSSATEPLAATVQAPVVTAAVLSPTRDSLVIVQGDDAGQGVYVVPMADQSGESPAATSASQTAPPVTHEPAATATPVPTEATPTPDATGGDDPVTSASPEVPVATEPPVATPGITPAPADTTIPDGSPSAEPGTGTPPAATVEPTAEPPVTPAPTPSVEVTPGPDGAIQIASDVVVVGPVSAYNPSGTRFAFTARPADGSTGPDVYVWRTSEPQARRVTSDHRSVFAGWHAGDLIVSRVGARDGTTWLVDPADGAARGPVSDGWLPSVSPSQLAAVWWDGEARFGRDGVTPRTGDGRLVLGPWERDGETKTLAEGPLRGWSAEWDSSGSVLAVWTAGPTDTEPGSLSLYRVAEGGRTVDLENPIRDGIPAFAGFDLDTDHLVWSATNDEGKRVVRVLAWNDEGSGVAEFASEDGGTIVH
jgi:hypothetical protein